MIRVNQGCRLSVSTDARPKGESMRKSENESFFCNCKFFDDELK